MISLIQGGSSASTNNLFSHLSGVEKETLQLKEVFVPRTWDNCNQHHCYLECLVREREFLQQIMHCASQKERQIPLYTYQVRNTEPCAAALLLQMQLQVVYILHMLSFTHLQTEPNIGLHAEVITQQVRG